MIAGILIQSYWQASLPLLRILYIPIFRFKPENPDVWSPTYNYIMLLKMWCCADAVKNGYAKGMIAWVDFGYNHGGSVISSDSDFNYTWRYDFPEKINIFSIQALDDKPIFDIVFSMDTYLMGAPIVGADYLWSEFWDLMRQNMFKLNDCGIADDDQNVILMCYRQKPEIFNVILSSWFLPLYEYGGKDYLIILPTPKQSLLKVKLKLFKQYLQCFKFSFRIFKHSLKYNLH